MANDCLVIHTTGKFYVSRNLTTNAQRCFTIVAPSVTLDCMGHAISGGESSEEGISVFINANNPSQIASDVVVENCIVTGFDRGVYGGWMNHLTLRNITAVGNRNVGFYIEATENSTFTDITARSNGGDGIYWKYAENVTLVNAVLESNAENGIIIKDLRAGSRFKGLRACSNGISDILCDASGVFGNLPDMENLTCGTISENCGYTCSGTC